MIFLEEFNLTLIFFYYTGLSPSTRSGSGSKFLDVAIVVTMSTLCASITIYLVFVPHFTGHGVIFTLIYYGSLPISLLMIISANLHCYFKRNVYHTIVNQVVKLEKHFDEKALTYSIKRLAFLFRIKFVILYWLCILSQTFVILEDLTFHTDRIGSTLLIFFIRATYPMQLLHFVLFSDVATLFFRELNTKVQKWPSVIHKSAKITYLKYIKLVHSDLWKLIVGVNNFFGWNLLFTSIFWFIYITHQLYWIFLTIHEKYGIFPMLGK